MVGRCRPPRTTHTVRATGRADVWRAVPRRTPRPGELAAVCSVCALASIAILATLAAASVAALAAPLPAQAQPARARAVADAPVLNHDGVTTIPEMMKSTLGARQLVVITGARLGSRLATLRLFTYRSGDWVRVFSVPVRLGTNGLTDGLTRHAGNRTTPTGIWRLPDFAFGTGVRSPSGIKLHWRHITPLSWWSAEHNSTYNTWVETSRHLDGEHLADMPVPYEFAINSGYNARPNLCVYGRGKAIFLHVEHSGYSAGCIMLARADMIRLLRLLDPGRRPACAIGTLRTGTRTCIYSY
jgi:L,D-peptidoglycan transpeptidase YkuD (ErfK/YbiS/YcfS/YnhG family)